MKLDTVEMLEVKRTAKKKDGRAHKSAEHRKKISEGLKRHHAAKKSKKWIKDAIKHPGALTRKAKRLGLVSKTTGHITQTGLKKLERSKNLTTRREARLAETLKNLPRHTGPRKKKRA